MLPAVRGILPRISNALSSSRTENFLTCLQELPGSMPDRAGKMPALPRHTRTKSRGPSIAHAIFRRNRKAQKAKSKTDITMRTARFGQYSKRFAPRNMMARMSAMK
jgi:hypothetical protein